jgi:molybdopterin molybdotransferase
MKPSLKLRTVEEAKKTFFSALENQVVPTETIETIHSFGRVIVEPIISSEYLPAFTRSSMDGYAVKAMDILKASELHPILLTIVGEVPMGSVPDIKVREGEAALIHTGGMLPDGADAVVILEVCSATSDGKLEVRQPVRTGDNLIFKGEDVKPGDMVIPAWKHIRPADVGGLLSLGHTWVKVATKPKIAILSSGDEVILPEQIPQLGQVRDVNSGSLAVLVEQAGGIAKNYPIVPDDRERMEAAFHKAFEETDALLVSAGSSASDRDISSEVIQTLGKPGVLVHGINFRPGKPTILAVCDGKPVIGLPGNPISALVIGEFFVKPLLDRMQGIRQDPILPMIKAVLAEDFTSQAGKEEWVPVKLVWEDGRYVARPFFFKSNLIFQLSNADGLMKILPEESIKKANSEVDVLLY